MPLLFIVFMLSKLGLNPLLTMGLRAAVVRFLFSPVLLHKTLLSTILSIALYVVPLSYYLNFLGYSALPFLDHTEVTFRHAGVHFS